MVSCEHAYDGARTGSLRPLNRHHIADNELLQSLGQGFEVDLGVQTEDELEEDIDADPLLNDETASFSSY